MEVLIFVLAVIDFLAGILTLLALNNFATGLAKTFAYILVIKGLFSMATSMGG